jgi:hypothetical protein
MARALSKKPKPFKKSQHYDLYHIKRAGKTTGKVLGVLGLVGLLGYGASKGFPILKQRINEKLLQTQNNVKILQEQLRRAQQQQTPQNKEIIERLQNHVDAATVAADRAQAEALVLAQKAQLAEQAEQNRRQQEIQNRQVAELRAKKMHQLAIINYKLKIAEIIFALTKHRVTEEELDDLCNTYNKVYKKLQTGCGMSWRDPDECANRAFKKAGIRRQDLEKMLKEIGCR